MTRTMVKGLDWIVRKFSHGRHALRRQTILKVGLVTVLLFLLVTALAQYSWFTPYDPIYYRDAPRLEGPSVQHWMGTDQLHRDVFSRVIADGKASLIVAFGAVALSMSIGSVLGWVSGFTGGFFDRFLSLTMDAIYSFPSMILAMTLVAMFGAGVGPMIWAVGVVYIPTYFRVTRAEVDRKSVV